MNDVIRLKPTRNFCVSNRELFFLTRGFNGLFRYSLDKDELSYLGNAINKSIDQVYQYSSVYRMNDDIFMVPVYADGYAVYSIESKSFRYIYTKNSKRSLSFDISVGFNENIFCFPVWNEDPIVVFNMTEEAEKREISFPDVYKRERREIYQIQKISDEIVICLLKPGNVLLTIDLSKEAITDDHVIDSISGNIDSFFCDDDLLFVHVEGDDAIIVIEKKGELIKRIDIGSKDLVELIGKWKGHIFVDQFVRKEKVLIDRTGDHKVSEFVDFDDAQHKWTRQGVIGSDPDTGNELFFSGNSGHIYESVETGVKIHPFLSEDVKGSDFYLDYIRRQNNEMLCIEDDILGLDNYIDILNRLE